MDGGLAMHQRRMLTSELNNLRRSEGVVESVDLVDIAVPEVLIASVASALSPEGGRTFRPFP